VVTNIKVYRAGFYLIRKSKIRTRKEIKMVIRIKREVVEDERPVEGYIGRFGYLYRE